MTHRILHLSDTHVGRTGPDEDGVDAVAALRGLLHDLRHVRDLDLIMVSGDVADDGSATGCRTVRGLIAGFAAERGLPQIYCTGNHDRRDGFQAALGSGHLDASGADVGRSGVTGRCAAVSRVAGLRVITLDSLVVGRTEGALDEAQLDWLRAELADPAPEGSVLMLHHPPLWSSSTTFEPQVVLQQPERLAAVITGTDLQVVLCGHLHHQISGVVGGIPVWTTPGVLTRIDLTAPPNLVRGVLGASASVIELGGPYSPVCELLYARDARAGEQVYAEEFDR